MLPGRQQMLVSNLTENKRRRQRTMGMVAWKQAASPNNSVLKLQKTIGQ